MNKVEKGKRNSKRESIFAGLMLVFIIISFVSLNSLMNKSDKVVYKGISEIQTESEALSRLDINQLSDKELLSELSHFANKMKITDSLLSTITDSSFFYGKYSISPSVSSTLESLLAERDKPKRENLEKIYRVLMDSTKDIRNLNIDELSSYYFAFDTDDISSKIKSLNDESKKLDFNK